jgi:hypothetical protein
MMQVELMIIVPVILVFMLIMIGLKKAKKISDINKKIYKSKEK